VLIKTESIYKSNKNAKLRGLGLRDQRGLIKVRRSVSALIETGVEKML
jgi:hypothetical protein